MAKGTMAFVGMLAVIASISILGGLGFYTDMGVDYNDSSYDADVQAAADALVGQEASNTGSSVFTDFTVGAANALSIAWQVIANTSGVLKLLFSLPDILADTIQVFFQIMFGITFAGFVRGAVID